jgi:hypothetical protein
MSEPLRDPRVKVWPTSRIIVVSVVYLVLATGAAWLTLGVAMSRAADMGHYQVQKTREFLGTERALELEEFRYADAAAETGNADAAATGTADE